MALLRKMYQLFHLCHNSKTSKWAYDSSDYITIPVKCHIIVRTSVRTLVLSDTLSTVIDRSL